MVFFSYFYLGLNVVHSVSALVFAGITFELTSIDGAWHFIKNYSPKMSLLS